MATRFFILVSWLTVTSLSAFAQVVQNGVEDQKYIAKDTATVDSLLSVSRKYLSNDPPKSIVYSRNALKAAKALYYTKGVTSALALLSRGYYFMNDKQRSLQTNKALLDVYKRTKNLEGQAATLHNTGNTFKFLGGYTQALNYYLRSLRLYERLSDKEKRAMVMKDIGVVHEAQGADSTAEKYYLQSLQLLQEVPERNYSKMTMIATAIGDFYQNNGESQEALFYLNKALYYAKRIPGKYKGHAIAMTLTNLGSLYEDNHNYEQALYYNRKSFKVAKQTGNNILLALNYENRGRIYKNMDSLERSNSYYARAKAINAKMGLLQSVAMIENAIAENYLKMKESNRAGRHALQALETASSGNYPEQAVAALELLVKIKERAGQYKNALEYQRTYQAVMDTLLNREKADQLLKLNTLYETEKKEKQIALLQNKTEKEKTLRLILFGGIILLVIIGLLIFNQERIKRRKNEALFASRQALAAEQLKNIQMHEATLEQEISMKNKELTTYALNVVQKNQTMEELNQKVRAMRKEADGTLLKNLTNLQHTIGHNLNLDKDWDEFRLYFEQVHHQFFKVLNSRFPELSSKELRLCALLKLNLSTKEMTTLLGISPGSVKMARYRLRKKLRLTSEDDLTCFLINLEKEASGGLDA